MLVLAHVIHNNFNFMHDQQKQKTNISKPNHRNIIYIYIYIYICKYVIGHLSTNSAHTKQYQIISKHGQGKYQQSLNTPFNAFETHQTDRTCLNTNPNNTITIIKRFSLLALVVLRLRCTPAFSQHQSGVFLYDCCVARSFFPHPRWMAQSPVSTAPPPS